MTGGISIALSTGGGLATAGPSLTAAVPWLEQLLLVGVASARFAFAFVFVPLFNQNAMPATVRNSIIIAFGLVAYSMNVDFRPNDLSAMGWAITLLKEMAAGGIIGFFFGTVLWAMESAGEIIDTKVGATIGQLVDPLSGSTTSITAVLLGRFAQIVFVTAGGLTIMVGVVMESYVIWPLGPGPLQLDRASVALFEGEFGRMFTMAFLFAAPILIILYLVDAGMGFLNRFAQQFNVFALSMPIKAMGALLMLILILPLLAEAVVADLNERAAISTGVLSRTAIPVR
jgi:type III secretion protein T